MLVMGMMNPYIDNGTSICVTEWLIPGFCPGEGLGHSIAYTFRGDLGNAIGSHPFGPAAILIMGGRVLYLWKSNFNRNKHEEI